MTKKIAIIQSNYIPWKGYFDLINSVDEFVLYDDIQYTRRDWRNRNKIKTSSGLRWLTIPVEVKGKYLQTIQDTKVADRGWARAHWATIRHAYRRAPFFEVYEHLLQDLYLQSEDMELLSDINRLFIDRICEILGITTTIRWSSELRMCDGRSERLLDICKQLGASEYISGPAARGYLQTELFDRAGISVTWYQYDEYREYDQLYPPFTHNVSVVDLLVHTGLHAPRHMKSFENAHDTYTSRTARSGAISEQGR